MTREKPRRRGPSEDRRGLTNGNGPLPPAGLTNGLGRTNGTGRTNGLTNGLTNGVRGRTNGLTNGLASRTTGLTNGLATGTGRTNGMTNGVRGRANGLTNGSGHTNGTGVINGLVNGTFRRGLRHNRYGVITQRDLRLGISIVVLFLLLLGPFYLLMSTSPPPPPTRILVDGNLADWAGIPFLNDTLTPANANVALRGYSVHQENGYTSFAVRVAGIALGDSTDLDGFYIFIDKDSNAATGYRAREIGADYMVAVRGGNNAISSSGLYGFRSGTSQGNWSGWESVDSARAAVSANGGLEVQLLPGEVDWASPVFLVAASDYEGNETMGTVHFGLSLRALQVEQVRTADSVTSSNQPIADLQFTAFGSPVDVTRVQVTRTHSSATLPDIPAFTVTPATPITRSVTVVYTPADVNDYVTAHVDANRVETTGGVPVTIDGPDLVAYLLLFGGTPPTDHRVEGFFGDWTSSPRAPDSDVAADANVDISHYAANHTVIPNPSTFTAFVYADVSGRIFGGSGVVERIEKATGGGGGGQSSPGPARPRVGEDLFRAYIDVDTAGSAGTMSLGVRADYRVDVTGIYGRIASKTAYQWSGTAWVVSSRTVTVANDRSRIEASLDLAGVTTGTMAMAIVASDWRLLSDATDVYSFLEIPGGGTRGAPGMDPLNGTNAASVTAFPLTGVPLVDGACSDGVYGDAGTFSNANLSGKAGTSGSYVYICIDAVIDMTSSGIDAGYIYFDRDHSGGAAPLSGDRRFYVFSNSTSLVSNKGDGAGWVLCDTDCDSANAAAGAFSGAHEVYEFKVAFTDVWGTSSPAPSQTAGFAVIGFDTTGSNTYTWGSDSPPNDVVPDTWGHILAPEFHDILVPIAVVGVIYFVARRRRRDADS